MDRAPRRPRRAPRGPLEPRPPWTPDPLHGGLRRSRLEGQPHPRTLERREPADRSLLRDEDRPDQLLEDVEPRRSAIRQQGPSLEGPGPIRADRLRVPPRLHEG